MGGQLCGGICVCVSRALNSRLRAVWLSLPQSVRPSGRLFARFCWRSIWCRWFIRWACVRLRSQFLLCTCWYNFGARLYSAQLFTHTCTYMRLSRNHITSRARRRANPTQTTCVPARHNVLDNAVSMHTHTHRKHTAKQALYSDRSSSSLFSQPQRRWRPPPFHFYYPTIHFMGCWVCSCAFHYYWTPSDCYYVSLKHTSSLLAAGCCPLSLTLAGRACACIGECSHCIRAGANSAMQAKLSASVGSLSAPRTCARMSVCVFFRAGYRVASCLFVRGEWISPQRGPFVRNITTSIYRYNSFWIYFLGSSIFGY